MRRAPRLAVVVVAVVCGALEPAAQQPTAQQPAASRADVERDLRAAAALLEREKFVEAAAEFRGIIESAHRLGLEAEEVRAQCGLGDALTDGSEFAAAQPAAQRCLDMAERIHNEEEMARAMVALSIGASANGRAAEAAALADRAVAVSEAAGIPRMRAVALMQQIRVRTFPPAEEIAIIQRVIEDSRLAAKRNFEAGALHLWGDILFQEGQLEEAFEKLTRARAMFHEIGRFAAEGTVLNSLGRLYRAHGRLDEALTCQMQALALHEKYGGPLELMQSHNAVAVVNALIGNVTEARRHYERALEIARQSGSPRIQDFLQANIATLLADQGEFAKAAPILEDVIAHGFDSYPSMRLNSLSLAYLRLNRPADALAAAGRALDACGDVPVDCVNALTSRAYAYGAMHDDAAALADLVKAIDTIEGLRAHLVPSDLLKQNFLDARQDLYSARIAMAARHHQDRESLETAELASSRAFLDLLAARGSASAGSGPTAGLTLRGAPAPAGDLASPATAISATADDTAAIARRLHSTVVVYWPAKERLFIWVIKPDGEIRSRTVEVSRARLVELIAGSVPFEGPSGEGAEGHPRAVATRGAASVSPEFDAAARRPWRQLYELLIAPIRSELPRSTGSLLTIVPHGVLMKVSFAALQAQGGRYLLEDYAIHYAPAAAVLQFTQGMGRPDGRRGAALLVADPVTARQSPLDPPLPPLPGARREVASIAALIPRSRVTRLEGRAATQPLVTAATAGKTVIHFATHAIVRDDAPNDSYLALGPENPGAGGLLTAREVYDLRLTADLVVLSACRSGGGRVTGDGIATFARAFLYAGAPSVVVSLWDVADEPTSRLLPAFYRTWLNGASKARSLRRAQLQLLADLRAGLVRVDTRAGPVVLPEHPAFWAGFVLIGEPE